MQTPTRQPSIPSKFGFTPVVHREPKTRKSEAAIEPAGCCVQVCTPFGCHCVLDLPICN